MISVEFDSGTKDTEPTLESLQLRINYLEFRLNDLIRAHRCEMKDHIYSHKKNCWMYKMYASFSYGDSQYQECKNCAKYGGPKRQLDSEGNIVQSDEQYLHPKQREIMLRVQGLDEFASE